MTVSNDEMTRTVREPPRINSEQRVYGKPPTLYEDLDGGSDQIVLGVTLKPIHKQWNRNPVWNEPKTGIGEGLYGQLPSLCVLLHVVYPVLFVCYLITIFAKMADRGRTSFAFYFTDSCPYLLTSCFGV